VAGGVFDFRVDSGKLIQLRVGYRPGGRHIWIGGKCIPENCQFSIASQAKPHRSRHLEVPYTESRRRPFSQPLVEIMAREMSRSRELQRRAERYLPGGVNSPVRAFRAVGGDPPFLVRAEGATLWDADGNRYLDYFGSWGPMILGHAHPLVVEAIQQAAARSASFGASTAVEADLAELVIAAVPSMEKLRFVSSGTEATMSAIRVARAFTNRKYVLKFEGCYHGHSDGLLVKAGSGLATFGLPGSAGVPPEVAHWTLTMPFNDLAAVEEAFASHPDQIACVIVEPVVGNMGCVAPAPGYLEGLRSITRETGSVLIFDEVMTGFRLALGGAQQVFGIEPDLTCMGKIIGGGLPCAAFGGKAKLMDLLAPLGPVYQAGTLSGNPLAMAAGIATLRYLAAHQAEVYGGLETRTAAVAEGIAGAARDAGIEMETNRVGSMVTWFFTKGRVTDFTTAAASDTEAFGRFQRAMLDQGVWLPPSQFEAGFLSAAHTNADIDFTIGAARTAFASMHATRS
jgi:glutamate-1-semialdehyde 2,1-aminomutase